MRVGFRETSSSKRGSDQLLRPHAGQRPTPCPRQVSPSVRRRGFGEGSKISVTSGMVSKASVSVSAALYLQYRFCVFVVKRHSLLL